MKGDKKNFISPSHNVNSRNIAQRKQKKGSRRVTRR